MLTRLFQLRALVSSGSYLTQPCCAGPATVSDNHTAYLCSYEFCTEHWMRQFAWVVLDWDYGTVVVDQTTPESSCIKRGCQGGRASRRPEWSGWTPAGIKLTCFSDKSKTVIAVSCHGSNRGLQIEAASLAALHCLPRTAHIDGIRRWRVACILGTGYLCADDIWRRLGL